MGALGHSLGPNIEAKTNYSLIKDICKNLYENTLTKSQPQEDFPIFQFSQDSCD